MSIKRITVAALGALLLAGCNGIGKGSKPESLKILQITPSTVLTRELLEAPTEPAEVKTCLRSALALIVTFSNGDVGDFTARARWRSDDKSIVRVSNAGQGDDPEEDQVPDSDGLVFGFGSLTPVGVGSTTITANYQGLTATIPVTVTELDTTQIKLSPKTQVMAPLSNQAFTVTAVIDGVETDVSSVVNLRFAEANEDVAVIDGSATNIVTAKAPGATPLTLQARFNSPCAVTPTATIRVAELKRLRLDREANFYPEGTTAGENRIARGYSEMLRAVGEFDGIDLDGDSVPDEQDLSRQVNLQLTATNIDPAPDNDDTTTEPTIVAFGSRLFGLTSQVIGNSAGVVDVSAKYIVDLGADGLGLTDDDVVVSTTTPVTLEVVATADDADPIQSMAVSPLTPTITTAFGRQQFRATGTFLPESGVSLVHDVSRHVFWAVSKEEPADAEDARTIAVISNFGLTSDGGLVTSLLGKGDEGGTVTVSAFRQRGALDTTPPAASDPTDLLPETTLTITPPPAQ